MPTKTEKSQKPKAPRTAKPKVFTAKNTELMDILSERFSTPSGNYFLNRKRQKIHDLLMVYIWSNQAPESPRKTLVDIGSGHGVDLFMMRDWINHWEADVWQYTGVEIDPTAMELLKLKKDEIKATDVTLVSADISQPLPFEDDSLDIVFVSDVLEYQHKPEFLISEIHRVLKKPDGAFILVTPNEPNPFQPRWWSPEKRQQMKDELEALKADPENKKPVSLRTTREWDRFILPYGFEIGHVERGALFNGLGNNIHGGSEFMDHELTLGLRFLAEALLDLLPKRLTRPLSSQLITLYLTE